MPAKKPSNALSQWALHGFTLYEQNPPAEAQFKVNGQTPLQRVQDLHRRRRDQVRGQQVSRYDSLRTTATERADEATEAVAMLSERLPAKLAAMRAGRLSPDDLMAFCREGVKIVQFAQRAADLTEADAEAATEMIDTDPADYEQSNIERFPSLAKALPIVTEEYLLGEDTRDPLGER